MIPEGAIVSGFISKLINDAVDVTRDKIKKADQNRKTKHQGFETRIYQVIIDAINEFTYNRYKNQDIIYDAAENMLNGLKNGEKDNIATVKFGLNIFVSNVDESECKGFIKVLCHEISRENNFDVFKEVLLLILEQKKEYSINELLQIEEKLDEVILRLDNKTPYNEAISIAESKMFQNNKKQKYIENWNSRLFLHLDNDERPITLADAFIFPNYEIYNGIDHREFLRVDILDKRIDKFVKYKKTSTLLITGEPGIGKSSIISWIVNRYINDDRFIVLRFRDWQNEDLKYSLLKAIILMLNCKKENLEDKILILEGFDEMKSLYDRDLLLSNFVNDILDYRNLKVIITSRPGYLDFGEFKNIIRLLPFDFQKIEKFYQIITGKNININNIKEYNIIGIPVILYMAIMSGIDITKNTTKPELYNRIFAKQGGIFDKFSFEGNGYDEGSQLLRNRKNIKIYLEFLQNLAFKMFEMDKLILKSKLCEIPKLSYQDREINILEFPIKHFFDSIKYDIEFIHKSMYEYFVSEYIFMSICENLDTKKEVFSGVLGNLFKENRLTDEIIEFLKYKFANCKMEINVDFIYESFQLMLQDGMTYYTKKYYKNVIRYEINIFANMLDFLHIWKNIQLKFSDEMSIYIMYNNKNVLNLKNILGRDKEEKLCGAYLEGV